MSAREVIAPLYVVTCDTDGCTAEYRPINNLDKRSDIGARFEAAAAGWTVRPARGKGSRTAPDFCPACTQRIARVRAAQGVTR